MAATVTGTGSIDLRLTRRFAAPRERVFNAWTTPEALVTVEFHSIDGGTEVVVVHQNFPDVRIWQRHRSGWIAACDRMERLL